MVRNGGEGEGAIRNLEVSNRSQGRGVLPKGNLGDPAIRGIACAKAAFRLFGCSEAVAC
jgi:hypothetical protein